MVADFLDKVEAIFQLRHVAARVGEDDLLELLEGLRVADEARKRRDTRARRKHIEPAARHERIQHQRARRLFAHQHLVPGLDPLQMRRQRSVRHLDREEFQFLVPGRARDRIGTINGLVANHQADHRKFARAEAELLRARHAEAEEPVGVVFDARHRFSEDACRSLYREIFFFCRSIHRDHSPINGDAVYQLQADIPTHAELKGNPFQI